MGAICLRLRHRGARRGRSPRGVSGGRAQCMCLLEEGAYEKDEEELWWKRREESRESW
jgi:hypothetical protein